MLNEMKHIRRRLWDQVKLFHLFHVVASKQYRCEHGRHYFCLQFSLLCGNSIDLLWLGLLSGSWKHCLVINLCYWPCCFFCSHDKQKLLLNTIFFKQLSPPSEKSECVQDTVGALCVDHQGNVAAASSSGGIWLKHPGRLGPVSVNTLINIVWQSQP